MDKKKLTGIIAAVVVIIIVVVIVTRLSPALPGVEPALATLTCTEVAADSLTARGEVTDIGAGPLSLRGFAYIEGTTGNPEIAIIPLENPSFELGDPPDGWTYGGADGTSSRSTEQAKTGIYSLKLENAAGTVRFAEQHPGDLDYYSGRTVTFGAWVYATTADRFRIRIYDNDGTGWQDSSSTYHTGGGTWEWLTVTRTLRPDLTDWMVRLFNHGGVVLSGYFDSAVLVEGRAVFEHGSFGTGAYSLSITDLKPDTTYRIRAFGQNESGIWYGDAVNCKTLQEP